MVSSVWIGSTSTVAISEAEGNPGTSNALFVWRGGSGTQGVTVSAQATLSSFEYEVDLNPDVPPGSRLFPNGNATASIKAYRLGAPSLAFVNLNPPAPTLNNVENVIEILFELSVVAAVGQYTSVTATMVGTVFIQ